MDLRANTAVDVLIGPFVDSGDGNTTEDGLTLSQADIKLSKNGQALAQKTDVTAAAFDDDGYYNCELDATDTNTEGNLVLIVHESGALPVRHEYNILAESAWDSMYVAKDDGFMDVNIKTVGRTDTQETEANNLESACSNYSVTRGLTGTALPAAAADAGGGVPISAGGSLALDTILDANISTRAPASEYDTEMARITANVATEAKQDIIDTNVDQIETAVITNAAGTDVAADIIAVKAETAAILFDTGTTLQAELDGIQADTENIQSRLPAALVSGRMDVSVGAMAATVLTAAAIATDAITAAKIAADAIGSSELATTAVNEIRDAIFQGTLTEGYSADGAAVTLEEGIYEIMQSLTEFAIAGTTITVKKRDGSTSAMTFSIDDASDPTSRTRAT